MVLVNMSSLSGTFALTITQMAKPIFATEAAVAAINASDYRMACPIPHLKIVKNGTVTEIDIDNIVIICAIFH